MNLHVLHYVIAGINSERYRFSCRNAAERLSGVRESDYFFIRSMNDGGQT